MSKKTSSKKSGQLALSVFQILLLLGIGAIAGVALGLLFNPMPPVLLVILWGYASLFISFYLQIIFHEGGHLVMGLATGYRFLSFRIGSFMWIKRNGKIRFGRFSLPGTGGQCLLLPPAPKEDGSYPIALYNWGGVLLNLITIPLCVVLAILLRSNPYLSFFFVILALIGLYFAILNGIPFKHALIPNDAANAKLIGQSPSSYRAMRITHQVLQEIADGQSICDLPEEWFVMPSVEEMQNSFTTTLAVLSSDRLIYQHDFDAANKQIDYLLTSPIALNSYHRNYLKMHQILCLLMIDDTPDAITSIYTKEIKQFIQMLGSTIEGLICQYALALLWKKNPPKAITLRKKAEKLAAKHPYPSEATDMLKLLDEIDRLSALRNAIPGVPQQGERL